MPVLLAALAAGAALVWLLWLARPMMPAAPRDLPIAPWTAAPAPFRLGVLGTSLSHSPGWPEALAAEIEACLKAPVTLIRVTQPGAGSAWGVTAAGEMVAAAPDAVVMEFAINDADLLDGVGLARSLRQQRQIIERLRTADPDMRIVLLSTSPAHGARGWIRPRLGAYYAALPDLAAGTGAGLVDGYAYWMAAPPETRRFPDGLHPPRQATETVLVPPLAAAFTVALSCR